jgi:pectate lyase
MNKRSFIFVCIISITALLVWFSCNPFQAEKQNSSVFNVLDESDFVRATAGPEGYASLNGGTTGGAGGTTVTVTDGAQLSAEIAAGGPKIIYVNGQITLANSGAKVIYVKRVSNISIIGVGANADFNGIGFKCVEANNIIIQNVKVHHTYASENKDGVEIDTCSNIWVDHCEFYNESPAVQSNKDYYDGLIDTKKGSKFVTISWNYFHDHWKGCLAGHSDSETGDVNLTVTYHHNYFKNIGSRTPLLRYGKVHMYNNYFKDIISSGSNIRMGANIKIDNCVYENAGSGSIDSDTGLGEGPIGTWYSATVGYWNLSGVQYINCKGNQPTTSTSTFVQPYTFTADPTANVASIVTAGAGLLK